MDSWGAFVVLRRLALMADSLSHSLLPGLVLGVISSALHRKGLFFGALFAAFFVALGAQLIARSSRVKEDTALGILYTVAFSLGLVLLTFVKVRVSLIHYLFGNILGLADSDLWLSYGVALLVIPAMAALQRPFLLSLFEPNVARSQGVRVGLLNVVLTILLVLTMTASVQAVGVILMGRAPPRAGRDSVSIDRQLFRDALGWGIHRPLRIGRWPAALLLPAKSSLRRGNRARPGECLLPRVHL
jgi:ABC-type Mn2+/Zn2+ transport system permease subunit